MGSLFKRGKKWVGKYKVDGKWKNKTFYSDKMASQQALAELEKRIARKEVGLFDPYEDSYGKPIQEHLEAFLSSLEHGTKRHYQKKCRGRMERFFRDAQIKTLADLTEDRISAFLLSCVKDKGLSAKTRDDYLAGIKQFCRWLDERKLIRENPCRGLRKIGGEHNAVFERRALSLEELQALSDAAIQRSQAEVPYHPRRKRKILRDGENRSLLYRFVGYCGLRRTECKMLVWSDLDLDSDFPCVTVRAAHSKNKKEASVPLHPSLVESLKEERKRQGEHLQRPVRESEPVFYVPKAIAKILRADAEAAGIEIEAGQRLDFHALRTSCGTFLSQAGVPIKDAQAILRHSDPMQTMKAYQKAYPHHLRSSISLLPDISLSLGADVVRETKEAN